MSYDLAWPPQHVLPIAKWRTEEIRPRNREFALSFNDSYRVSSFTTALFTVALFTIALFASEGSVPSRALSS